MRAGANQCPMGQIGGDRFARILAERPQHKLQMVHSVTSVILWKGDARTLLCYATSGEGVGRRARETEQQGCWEGARQEGRGRIRADPVPVFPGRFPRVAKLTAPTTSFTGQGHFFKVSEARAEPRTMPPYRADLPVPGPTASGHNGLDMLTCQRLNSAL